MRPQYKPGHLDYFEFKRKHGKTLLHFMFSLQCRTSENTKDFGGEQESFQEKKKKKSISKSWTANSLRILTYMWLISQEKVFIT